MSSGGRGSKSWKGASIVLFILPWMNTCLKIWKQIYLIFCTCIKYKLWLHWSCVPCVVCMYVLLSCMYSMSCMYTCVYTRVALYLLYFFFGIYSIESKSWKENLRFVHTHTRLCVHTQNEFHEENSCTRYTRLCVQNKFQESMAHGIMHRSTTI